MPGEARKGSTGDQLRILELGQLLALRERCRKRLAMKFLELGLEIKRFMLGRPPRHAQVNYPLGSRAMMQLFQHSPGLVVLGSRRHVPAQQFTQSQGPQAIRGVLQKTSPL